MKTRLMAILFLILVLFVSGCLPDNPGWGVPRSHATQGHKVAVMYYQVSCDGLYTHSYWYTGTLVEHATVESPGLVMADQASVDNHLGMDIPYNDPALGKTEQLPFGCYHFVIGGYSLLGMSYRDFLGITPQRIKSLP